VTEISSVILLSSLFHRESTTSPIASTRSTASAWKHIVLASSIFILSSAPTLQSSCNRPPSKQSGSTDLPHLSRLMIIHRIAHTSRSNTLEVTTPLDISGWRQDPPAATMIISPDTVGNSIEASLSDLESMPSVTTPTQLEISAPSVQSAN
jgi:hypothetical protein